MMKRGKNGWSLSKVCSKAVEMMEKEAWRKLCGISVAVNLRVIVVRWLIGIRFFLTSFLWMCHWPNSAARLSLPSGLHQRIVHSFWPRGWNRPWPTKLLSFLRVEIWPTWKLSFSNLSKIPANGAYFPQRRSKKSRTCTIFYAVVLTWGQYKVSLVTAVQFSEKGMPFSFMGGYHRGSWCYRDAYTCTKIEWKGTLNGSRAFLMRERVLGDRLSLKDLICSSNTSIVIYFWLGYYRFIDEWLNDGLEIYKGLV